MAAGPRNSGSSGGVLTGDRSLVEQVLAAAPLGGAAAGVQHLGAGGLLAGRGVDRVARAADAVPGAQRELVEAVVAGGVDRPRVAAGLALGQGRPVQPVRG